ncbi:MAG: hypothetical protein RLZZ175_1799 [Bacteroidota bacterium]|jgi:uncharacterized protein YqeY
MSLKKTIEADIKQAMLAKDKDTLTAVRSIKSLILLAETESGAAAELTPDQELKLLTKAAKQRRESAEVFKAQNRDDLAEKELLELAVIEKYLPKQLTEQEITEAIKAIIAEVGATSLADLGKVMGVATKSLAGKADGKVVSGLVKALLS